MIHDPAAAGTSTGRTADSMLPSLPVAIFQADREGRLTAANSSFRTLALAGQMPSSRTTPWSNAHPGDRAQAEAAWRDASERETEFSIEFRVWHRDGRLLWIRITASPLRDSMGRIQGYAGVALDDTETVGRRLLLERLLGVVEPSRVDAVLAVFRRLAELHQS